MPLLAATLEKYFAWQSSLSPSALLHLCQIATIVDDCIVPYPSLSSQQLAVRLGFGCWVLGFGCSVVSLARHPPHPTPVRLTLTAEAHCPSSPLPSTPNVPSSCQQTLGFNKELPAIGAKTFTMIWIYESSLSLPSPCLVVTICAKSC